MTDKHNSHETEADIEYDDQPIAPAARKPWRTPRVILSDVALTEVGGFNVKDSAFNQS